VVDFQDFVQEMLDSISWLDSFDRETTARQHSAWQAPTRRTIPG